MNYSATGEEFPYISNNFFFLLSFTEIYLRTLSRECFRAIHYLGLLFLAEGQR